MPDARCTRGLACNVHKKLRTRAYRAAEAIRHSLRKGAFGDVIALTSLDILSECSHLCRDSRWCFNGENYLVL